VKTKGNHYDFYEKLPDEEEVIEITVKKNDNKFVF
jgi:hypothetical protein